MCRRRDRAMKANAGRPARGEGPGGSAREGRSWPRCPTQPLSTCDGGATGAGRAAPTELALLLPGRRPGRLRLPRVVVPPAPETAVGVLLPLAIVDRLGPLALGVLAVLRRLDRLRRTDPLARLGHVLRGRGLGRGVGLDPLGAE